MTTHFIFLPGEFHGQRSLAGCSLWDCKESDPTERLTLSQDSLYLLTPYPFLAFPLFPLFTDIYL